MSSMVVRQALVPMAAGYLLIMAALGFGLRRLLRLGAAARQAPGQPARWPVPRRAAARFSRGWPALARQVIGTVIGGYLMLGTVVIVYYYAVARVGGSFIESAFTGTAMLIGIALPLFAAASWLTQRRHRHDATAEADGQARRH